MADKIAVLRAGKLEQFGAPLDLYNNPANTFVAGFIGSPRMNFLTGTVGENAGDEMTLRLAGGAEVRLPRAKFGGQAGQGISMGVRAHHFTIAEDGQLAMQVNSVEQLGGETYIYGEVEGGAPLTLHAPGQAPYKAGDAVRLAVAQDAAHLFSEDSGLTLAA